MASAETSKPGAPAEDETDQILHLARLVQSGTSTGGGSEPPLTPAQWTALRYFARANRFSRTPSAFSEFNATTRGTASQVVKSLIGMGLLQRHANETDGRSALIEITEAGRARLRDDPTAALGAAIAALEPGLRAALSEGIAALTSNLARQKGAPVFGNCRDCRHCDLEAQAAWCHCTQSRLDPVEMGALCIDFAPTARRA